MTRTDYLACLQEANGAYDTLNPLCRQLQAKKDYRFGSLANFGSTEVWSAGDATAAGLSAGCLRLLRIGGGRY